MKRFLLLFPFAPCSDLPAVAAPGQEPRQDQPQQARKTDYWLSRDMQRLVFWQSRDPEAQSADTATR